MTRFRSILERVRLTVQGWRPVSAARVWAEAKQTRSENVILDAMAWWTAAVLRATSFLVSGKCSAPTVVMSAPLRYTHGASQQRDHASGGAARQGRFFLFWP